MYGYAPDANTGKAIFQVGTNATLSTTNICDGKWHHLAGVDNNGSAALYVDGVLENTGSGFYTYYTGTTNAQLRLGDVGGQSTEYGLDEVRIWSLARTAGQIKAGFNTAPTTPQVGLDVYYNFNRGTAGGSNAG